MEKHEIDAFINTIFTPEELLAYESITPSTVDVETLKKTGYVTIEREEDENQITETVHYKSFDGEVSFTKVINISAKEKTAAEKFNLKNQIELAIKNEQYESAILYKDALKALEGKS